MVILQNSRYNTFTTSSGKVYQMIDLGQIFRRLLLCWAAATVMVLFTTKPNTPDGGVMSILQSDQLYQVLAEGFYYGAIVFAVAYFVERRKAKQQEGNVPAGRDSAANQGASKASLEETQVMEPEDLPPSHRSRDT